jgi:formate dehydrogenase subunit gamma
VTTSARELDEQAHRDFARYGKTRVYRGELLRHPAYTRFLHWMVAIFFVLALLTGFAIYTPWLFRWIAPIFGSGARTRLLHPWFGILFEIFFFFQFLNWFAPMAWTEADRRWMRRMRAYATNEEKLEAEDVGFFNAGQKLYFWAIAICGLLFLITGFLMWFDNLSPRWVVVVSYVVHDIAALVMLGFFIIHVYEGTAQQPGTFDSMIDGTVSENWAWTHHPAWYQEVTGRNPRESYERERRRMEERTDTRDDA